jgi:lipopolysaccharide assembly protein A
MQILNWLFRAFVFFALFAFALNNRHEAIVQWFFGRQWHAPMVMIVLVAFALGCAVGVFAMVPSWWRQRRVARQGQTSVSEAPPVAPPAKPLSESMLEHPPRDGL